jgi:outer membrane protein insertion porin family
MQFALQHLSGVFIALAAFSPLALGQMGGGMPAGPGGGAPAFDEPKFTDRVYESGGPRVPKVKDGALILSVVIEGNQSLSDNSIMAVLESREDRAFDHEIFNRDIAKLYRTNLFKKIEPYFTETPEGVHIKLVVHERPIVRQVSFLGNKRVDDRALAKHCGISKGDALDPISINSAKSRLIEYYQDKGMNNVDIRVITGLQPGDRDVEFLISEGSVERLNRVDVIGNKDFSSELLKSKLKMRPGFPTIKGVLNLNRVSDNKIEEDRLNLMAYYRQHGYFDARVDCKKDFNEAGDWVDLTYVIYEGQRYKIRSVGITGTKLYQPSELLPYMLAKEGEYFYLGNKSKDERFLYELYGVQGHYFCDVVGELVYQPDNQVDIIYNVGEGDIYRISDVRVHIDGDYTKQRVVLQPLDKIRPGSIINSRNMDDASRRLRFSQIFNTDPSQGTVPTLKVEPPEDVRLSERF